MVLWQQASISFKVNLINTSLNILIQKEDYLSALEWYKYSLALFTGKESQDNTNMAKLQVSYFINGLHFELIN